MLTDRIIEILNLPITAVIGKLPTPYNDYTLFLPFRKGLDYKYLLVTELSEFAKRRISLLVPYSEAEEEICLRLIQKKQVLGLSDVCIKGMTVIPDKNTKFISDEILSAYPFGTVYVPQNSIITPLADSSNIKIRKADFSCNSERFAEVFGQPKSLTD